ncbi:hypothetical protein [Streptomyces sp. 2A115]|uniref:hypothetical protein n=1 Tax=Streptomyces sp. 2A115 TaxID=3457439 RepID=UPI003FD3FFA0
MRAESSGNVRATAPTSRAGKAISAAEKLSSVQEIDLKEEIKLDDPTPGGAGTEGTRCTGRQFFGDLRLVNARGSAAGPMKAPIDLVTG